MRRDGNRSAEKLILLRQGCGATRKLKSRVRNESDVGGPAFAKASSSARSFLLRARLRRDQPSLRLRLGKRDGSASKTARQAEVSGHQSLLIWRAAERRRGPSCESFVGNWCVFYSLRA